MSLNGHYNASVRSYLLALQTGRKPDTRPEVPEYWQGLVATIERSYERSGGNVETIKATITSLCKQVADLKELLETERPVTLARVQHDFGMPPLPEHVRPDETLAAQASPTLDAIIEYIAHWATRSYEGYHESAALWILSMIAARRIKLPWRDGVWPSLYLMFVSRSGRVAKTEAALIAARILRECGLNYLLAPTQITPQRLLSMMSGSLPRNYSCFNDVDKEQERLAMAFAGQKGWLYDEFGDFLADATSGRSINGPFSQLLRQFYDGKLDYAYETNSRGREKINLPSLSIVGTSTPDSLIPVSLKSNFWKDGTAARFLFSAPPPDYVRLKSAPLGEAVVPLSIIAALKSWHKRLGIPECEIIDLQEQADLQAQADEALGKKPLKRSYDGQQYRIEADPLPQHTVYWEESGVYEAHQAYYAELQQLGVKYGLDSRLDSSYARLPDMALKVAMLLASLENNNQMTLAHWMRGQKIAERGRESLHCLLAQLDAGVPDRSPGYGTLEDAVVDILTYKMPQGEKASARQIAQWGNTLLRKAGSPEVRKILNNLVDEGQVDRDGGVNDKRAVYSLKPKTEESPLQG